MSSPFPFHGIFSSLGQEPLEPPPQRKKSVVPAEPELPPSFHAEKTKSSLGQVAVDIYEQDDYYIIKAPIAGVRLADIDIEITDNVITIRGTRAHGESIPDDQYYVQECFWGQFQRSITLPFPIDPKKVRATFNKENVLKILIPREEKVKIVRITEG